MWCGYILFAECHSIPWHIGHSFTKELARPYFHTNRNITTDNWFTSFELAKDLLCNCGLRTVGTLPMNKPHVPTVMKQKHEQGRTTVAFCFNNNLSLCFYISQKKIIKKIVLTIDTIENDKPEVIDYYNKTKGAVDTFDQMCSSYSCSRKTNRWQLYLFYGILNAATINAWIIHSQIALKD